MMSRSELSSANMLTVTYCADIGGTVVGSSDDPANVDLLPERMVSLTVCS